MQPDPRQDEFVAAAVASIRGLVLAHVRVDHPAIAAEVGRLLGACARYTSALAERPGDEPLRRAVMALNAGSTHSPPGGE